MSDVPAVRRLAIEIQAWTQLRETAVQSRDGRETGGILIGRDRGLNEEIVVVACGDPGPGAIRTSGTFSRDLEHARAIASAHQAPGVAWIGEWHTHLIDEPMPSATDLRTYLELLDDPETLLDRVIALIVLEDPDSGWDEPQITGWSLTGSVLRQLGVRITSSEEGK